jgi:hypothetical protein
MVEKHRESATEQPGSTSTSGRPKARGNGRGSGKSAGSGHQGGSRAAPGGKENDLTRDLRDFASGRPQGWEHDDWLNFLESLRSRGHNVHDTEAIGIALEKERLDLALSGVRGMGPQRRKALIEHYGTVWNLRNAEIEEIASVAKMPRALAEHVKTEVR